MLINDDMLERIFDSLEQLIFTLLTQCEKELKFLETNKMKTYPELEAIYFNDLRKNLQLANELDCERCSALNEFMAQLEYRLERLKVPCVRAADFEVCLN